MLSNQLEPVGFFIFGSPQSPHLFVSLTLTILVQNHLHVTFYISNEHLNALSTIHKKNPNSFFVLFWKQSVLIAQRGPKNLLFLAFFPIFPKIVHYNALMHWGQCKKSRLFQWTVLKKSEKNNFSWTLLGSKPNFFSKFINQGSCFAVVVASSAPRHFIWSIKHHMTMIFIHHFLKGDPSLKIYST